MKTAWTAAAACAAAGAAWRLAFAPTDLWWLAPPALSVLFWTWSRSTRAAHAALAGAAFACTGYGPGMGWPETLQTVALAPWQVWTGTALWMAGLAAYPAAVGAITVWGAERRSTGARMAVACGAWTLAEWIRGSAWAGFVWGSGGYALAGTPVGGWLPAGGAWAGSGAVAATAALIAWGAATRHKLPAAAGVAALAATGIGLQEWTAGETAPTGPAVVVAVVEEDAQWRDPERRESWEAREHWRERAVAAAHGADLVVWPETAVALWSDDDAQWMEDTAREVEEAGATLLAGVLDGRDAQHANEAWAPATEWRWRKARLWPFGEQVPLAGALAPLSAALGIEAVQLAAGSDSQEPMQWRGQSLGVAICYEAHFGAWRAREAARQAMEIVLSNDLWYRGGWGAAAQREIAQARAHEAGRWLLRSTRGGGRPAVLGPDGREAAPLRRRAHATWYEMQPRTGATPYARWGDAPATGAAGAVLAAGLAAGATARRRQQGGEEESKEAEIGPAGQRDGRKTEQ